MTAIYTMFVSSLDDIDRNITEKIACIDKVFYLTIADTSANFRSEIHASIYIILYYTYV